MAYLTLANTRESVQGGTTSTSHLCKDFICKIIELQEAQPATADHVRDNYTC